MTTFSFHARGAYPRYNEFADKMPPEVAEQIEIDRLKRLNEWNKDLTAAFAKLGASCKNASEALQTFGKVGIQLEGPHKTAWGMFSFENDMKWEYKVKWKPKTRPWRQ